LARRSGRREHRSIANIVERPLEAYELAKRAASRLGHGSDLDLGVVIHEGGKTDTQGRSFDDTKIMLETVRKMPGHGVVARLVRNDAERASRVTIAEIAFGIGKTRSRRRAARPEQGLASCDTGLPTGPSLPRKQPPSSMATA
jgi:hypothetical protein